MVTGLFYALDIQRTFHILSGPCYLACTEQRLCDTTAYHIIVTIVYHYITVFKQLEFLHTFVLHRCKVLLMSTTDIGNYPNRRAYDRFKFLHLSHFGNTGFEYSNLCIFIQQPHGKRHTNLRVITPWRACHNLIRTDNMIEPLFNHSLAIASGNSDYRNIKLFCDGLQPIFGEP